MHLGPGRILPLAAIIACASAAAQEVPPALKARIWDIPITIPAGAYRATHPVELRGDLDIKIAAGAWLDGVDFQSSEGTQSWNVDGGFLKAVRIGIPMGGTFDARNSLFDDCVFYKTPGNFAPLWSTRWRFENCVMTGDFMHAPVNMADFSIAARSCTFVGVEFVDFGLKEKMDPAEYLQSDNLVFDRCRFVRCKVPASVLAATKECVFEQCSFPSMRGSWPAQMTEVKVTAYWDGAARPSAPNVRKPLALEFSELPKEFKPVGSSLEFTASGGTLTARDFKKPDHFGSLANERGTSRDLSPD